MDGSASRPYLGFANFEITSIILTITYFTSILVKVNVRRRIFFK